MREVLLHMDGYATNQDLANPNVQTSLLIRNNFRLARHLAAMQASTPWCVLCVRHSVKNSIMVNLRATSFATLFSILTLRLKRSLFFGLLCALWCFPATVLAQDADASAIREHLEDLDNLARNHGFVFVGNVSSLRTRSQARCASGVEHRFSYAVTDPLWSDPDSPIAKDYVVEKGYIDCQQKPLAGSFIVGSKVIVYAEERPGHGYAWLPPLHFTPERLAHVQSWLADLRLKVGDPVLLRIRQHLMEQSNHSNAKSLVILGEVRRIAPMPKAWTVAPRRDIDIDITRVLAGHLPSESRGTSLRTWCNDFIKCSGLNVGSKVLGYCDLAEEWRGCLLSSLVSDANIKLLESWLSQTEPPPATSASPSR
jgi:hypothetical protein